MTGAIRLMKPSTDRILTTHTDSLPLTHHLNCALGKPKASVNSPTH